MGLLSSVGSSITSKATSSVTSAFDSTVSSTLNKLGLNITSSDYPFKGFSSMFTGDKIFDPGSTNRFAVVIEAPDDTDCEADAISLTINNSRTVSQDAHSVTNGSNILSNFISSALNSFLGSSYPTQSPYADVYSSGWVPCLGFSLEHSRIISEPIGITGEYGIQAPTSTFISPSLTTQILEDNKQTVRRWLKDYSKFICPYPGIMRPLKTCCCKITLLTYSKEWSRDPGDTTDSVMNLLGIGNSQNKTNNFLKFVFYGYPNADVSYQTSVGTNFDSVAISWNIVGEQDTTTNVVSNLVNKFI